MLGDNKQNNMVLSEKYLDLYEINYRRKQINE